MFTEMMVSITFCEETVSAKPFVILSALCSVFLCLFALILCDRGLSSFC